MMARIRSVDSATFAPFLERLTGPKFDTTAGAVDLPEMLAGAECFEVIGPGGNSIGGYALRVSGKTVWLLAAAMTGPGVDFEKQILPLIEQQAEPVGQVAVTTKRRGGIKKLLRQGYEITGYTLRKNLKKC